MNRSVCKGSIGNTVFTLIKLSNLLPTHYQSLKKIFRQNMATPECQQVVNGLEADRGGAFDFSNCVRNMALARYVMATCSSTFIILE